MREIERSGVLRLARREQVKESVRLERTSIRRHATVAIYCFGGAATGAAGKGEDQRTILPSLNLIV
jgi:hypothetical protein